MKAILPYTVTNKLGELLKKEQARRVLEQNQRVLLAEIEEELAEHCSLTRDGILRIKRGLSIASLPVAFKISDFFDTSISDIFVLTDKNGEEELELI